MAQNAGSEKVIAPHKARLLVIAGAVILLHAALLLIFWPHRWPASYKWVLLPDGMGAYFLTAFGLQQLKSKRIEREGHKASEGN